MRIPAILSMLALGLILLSAADKKAHATIVVGSLPLVGTDDDNPQDFLSDILDVIDAYNFAKDPDLTKDIMLFKKTDADAAFVFNATNGFEFFSDAGGTIPVTTESALIALETAYFSYGGSETIVYYDVKASKGFSLYEFRSSGLNLLTRDDVTNDISHLSFWKSTGDPVFNQSNAVPEPATFALAFIGLAFWRFRRRRV
jgi:hypothetical protein